METIITKQLLTFLETNNLLSVHQYGFRKARSTGDLLAYAVHVWSSALEYCGESRVISLDISKAFDRVWHKGLLTKLPMSGLNQTLINWIGSFLSDRSIAVRVDGFLSNLHSINAGVPQGSVISPVLFVLFINDLLTFRRKFHRCATIYKSKKSDISYTISNKTGRDLHSIQTRNNEQYHLPEVRTNWGKQVSSYLFIDNWNKLDTNVKSAGNFDSIKQRFWTM